jgi:squalene-associated FAD-dependent desaturase
MKKCVVIGGGLAGLSAAVFLSDKGFKIELLEAAPKLGGRTYSLVDQKTLDVVDNGQHILMGCYNYTLDFIKLINAENNFTFQNKLSVIFIKENNNLYPLKSKDIFYPFNLLFALLNYKALKFSERLTLLKFFAKLYFYSDNLLSKLSVHQWLLMEKQNENIIKSFWEILAVGALNTNINKASAKTFSDILKKIFFRGSKASVIILPKLGLTEAFCENSCKFIESREGIISTLETVEELKISEDKVLSIKTSRREIKDFDYVVSALPYFNLEKIIKTDQLFPNHLDFKYSTIIAIHIWLKETELEEDFYGLINSPIHWVFNHKSHLTLVISDANELAEVSKENLFEIAAEELNKYFKISKEKISSYIVIKEKRSTFIPSNEILNSRPNSQTQYNNFFIAGDWINTGLPSTIESAVKSGKIAAELICGLAGID